MTGEQPDLFGWRHEARASDPDTSKTAAKMRNRAPTPAKRRAWEIMSTPHTQRQVGEQLLDEGLVPTVDEGRRAARSVIEDFGLAVHAVDTNGDIVKLRNSSGRYGEAYQAVGAWPDQ